MERYPFARGTTGDAALSARLAGELVFDRVTFGYGRFGTPLLRDFSFAVGPGQQIALVGASGSGKSTAARLISGTHRPWSGQIRLDGTPCDEIPRSVLGAKYADLIRSL